MSVKVSINVAFSPSDVWQELRHIDRHVNWMMDAVSIDFIGEQREGIGTTFDCLTKIGPFKTVDRMTITEWQDGEVMGVEHRGIITGRGNFSLTPNAQGTTIEWFESLEFPWWALGTIGAIAASPVLKVLWKKNLRSFAKTLHRPS